MAYGQASERWYADGVDDLDAQRDRVIRALDMAAAWNEFVNPHVYYIYLINQSMGCLSHLRTG